MLSTFLLSLCLAPSFAADAASSAAVRIRSAAAELVLDVAGGSVEDNAPVIAYPWHFSANQAWYVQPLAGGAVWLRSVASGKSMALQTASAEAPIVQLTPANTAQQSWTFAPRGDGTYQLVNGLDGSCLALPPTASLGDAPLLQVCGSAATQGWHVESAPALCDSITCSGHGSCTATGDGQAACACDVGYHSEGLACVINPPPGAGRAKRGVGTWSFDGQARALSDLGAAWVYTWGPDAASLGVAPPDGTEFVPMIWGARDFNAQAYASARNSGSELLGINEPDHCDQACLTVDQVLAQWPNLMATGLRLGSPAPASGAASDGSWLATFMQQVQVQGLRVDFITVHWYAGTFDAVAATQQLQDYLQAVYERYQLPIWLTEFAMINFDGPTGTYPTLQQQAAFAEAATQRLDMLSYVERYAWYSLPPSGNTSNTHLYNSDGSPTAVGNAYRFVAQPPP